MKSNRRQFFAVTGAGAAAAWMPTIIPARAFGANDRVRTGHIGVRNQGTNNLKELLKNKNVDVAREVDLITHYPTTLEWGNVYVTTANEYDR